MHRSRALTGAAVLGAAFCVLVWNGSRAISALSRLAEITFGASSRGGTEEIRGAVALTIDTLSVAVAPILLAVFVVTLAILIVQRRPRFSLRFFGFSSKRSHPLAQPRGVALKGLAVNLVSSAAALVLTIILLGYYLGDIALLPRLTVAGAAAATARISFGAARWFVVLLVVVGLVDFLLLRKARGMRAQRDESPQTGGLETARQEARRRLHEQVTAHDPERAVESCSVVISHGARVSILLTYDEQAQTVPIVTMVAHRASARHLQRIARALGRPVVDDPSLALALEMVNPGAHIPRDNYEAVAKILAVTYHPSHVGE